MISQLTDHLKVGNPAGVEGPSREWEVSSEVEREVQLNH